MSEERGREGERERGRVWGTGRERGGRKEEEHGGEVERREDRKGGRERLGDTTGRDKQVLHAIQSVCA